MTANDSAFWRFSLRFYALPDVAPACLALQDQANVDVNLMLFLLFLADGGRAITRDDVVRLDASIAPWRSEVVEPLRALRRRLKSGVGDVPTPTSEGLRNMVKKIELEAERLEQGRLENAVPTLGKPAPRSEAAEANLAAYEAYLGRLPDAPKALILKAFSDQTVWNLEFADPSYPLSFNRKLGLPTYTLRANPRLFPGGRRLRSD